MSDTEAALHFVAASLSASTSFFWLCAFNCCVFRLFRPYCGIVVYTMTKALKSVGHRA
ncbi:hypothetical protein Plhal304r1_c066g0153861 [Plasmopara halstedii]